MSFTIEGDKLEKEIRRAEAVCGVATQIIANGTLVLKAEKFKDDAISADTRVPRFLLGGVNNEEDAYLDR